MMPWDPLNIVVIGDRTNGLVTARYITKHVMRKRNDSQHNVQYRTMLLLPWSDECDARDGVLDEKQTAASWTSPHRHCQDFEIVYYDARACAIDTSAKKVSVETVSPESYSDAWSSHDYLDIPETKPLNIIYHALIFATGSPTPGQNEERPPRSINTKLHSLLKHKQLDVHLLDLWNGCFQQLPQLQSCSSISKPLTESPNSEPRYSRLPSHITCNTKSDSLLSSKSPKTSSNSPSINPSPSVPDHDSSLSIPPISRHKRNITPRKSPTTPVRDPTTLSKTSPASQCPPPFSLQTTIPTLLSRTSHILTTPTLRVHAPFGRHGTRLETRVYAIGACASIVQEYGYPAVAGPSKRMLRVLSRNLGNDMLEWEGRAGVVTPRGRDSGQGREEQGSGEIGEDGYMLRDGDSLLEGLREKSSFSVDIDVKEDEKDEIQISWGSGSSSQSVRSSSFSFEDTHPRLGFPARIVDAGLGFTRVVRTGTHGKDGPWVGVAGMGNPQELPDRVLPPVSRARWLCGLPSFTWLRTDGHEIYHGF